MTSSDLSDKIDEILKIWNYHITSSVIRKVRNADVSTFLISETIQMYFSKIASQKMNEGSTIFRWHLSEKLWRFPNLTDFDDVIKVMTSLWRHHDLRRDIFGFISDPTRFYIHPSFGPPVTGGSRSDIFLSIVRVMKKDAHIQKDFFKYYQNGSKFNFSRYKTSPPPPPLIRKPLMESCLRVLHSISNRLRGLIGNARNAQPTTEDAAIWTETR